MKKTLIPLLCGLALAGLAATAVAQDRLKTMPGYEQYQRMQGKAAAAVRPGTVNVSWNDPSGKTFEYTVGAPARGGAQPKRYRYDIAARTASDVTNEPVVAQAEAATAGRGRQANDLSARGSYAREHSYNSPDGKLRAYTKGLHNLYLANADGSGEIAITTDGSPATRIRNAVPTYVYTEELAMGRSIWWSPDGRKIAYMRFDESKVDDYPLQMDQTKLYSTTRVIAYPSPGTPNPVPEMFIYDVATKQTRKVEVRDGKPFDDQVVGHYVWNVSWAEDNSEIRMRRANRAQNIIEWVGCSPATGACRTILKEQASTWATMAAPRFLADGRRFIQVSDRTGWDNFYLYDVSGRLLNQITNHSGFEVANIVRVDEAKGQLWYMARDGDNHMKMQLHRVGLDGRGDVRLTDPAWNHAVNLSPDGAYFIDTLQKHDVAPASRLMRINGDRAELVAELAASDTSAFDANGFKRVEMYTFKAADGKTDLHAMLHKPHNFDPTKTYPLIVAIYGGPNSNQASETFQTPDPMTEYGFLVLKADLRSASGRGKAFIDSIYGNFGQTEVDDQAAAVKALYDRPYVDKTRVGIYGTSYGGSMAAWSILRYPEVFQAAVSNSPVTDHRLYDSTYSERYMGLLPEKAEAYRRTSAMEYAQNLKGDLLIYYGTADDNVHPKNSMQLIQALQRAGKHFQVQVGPDAGHTAVSQARMMEFFIESLVIKPEVQKVIAEMRAREQAEQEGRAQAAR